MAQLWQLRIALMLAACGLAAPCWAETIEFVTYYPAPTAAGTASSQSMAIGSGYNGTTPADGELLVFDRLGIGPGFNVAQPISRLQVQGGASQTNYALFVPGAGGQMNVGIGTATLPTNRLTVTGPWTAGPGGSQVRIHSNGNGFPTGISGLGLTSQNGTGEWIVARHDNAGGAGRLPNTFSIGINGVGNAIDITPNFNVGIGTATPLSAIGNGSLQRSLEVNGWILARGNGSNTFGDPAARIGLINNGDQMNGWWMSANANNTFAIHQGGTGDRLSINRAGYVGINTTNPSQRLHVYEPNGGVWAAYIQGAAYGIAGLGSGGGHPVHGYNTSYGNWGSLGYSSVGGYFYTPQGNWASISSGAYYGVYGYGGYYGGYFQNGNYWQPALFAYNGGSGYWSHIGYGYFGLYTNGHVVGSAFYYYSSKDKKKNISVLTRKDEASILSTIDKLPIVHYQWKEFKGPNPSRLGLVAEWSPDEIKPGDDKAIDVASYVTYSIAGVKALSAKVKYQEETIQQQQEELRQLKQQFQEFQGERNR